MRVIVTGGAGFIGSNLVKRLVSEGAIVRVIDNLWRGSLDNLRLSDGSPVIDFDKQFHLADLTNDSACLDLIRNADLVYHLADVVGGVHFALTHEPFVFRQNILINSNVLSACLINKIPNYIYAGTACSFPKHLQMQDGIVSLKEDQTYPAEPESSYGWSKLMGEYESQLVQTSGLMNVGLLRLHNVYGPGVSFDPTYSQVIPSLIYKAIHFPQAPFIVWGTGNQYRDFVYIDDVVNGLILMFSRGMNKGTIQIGSEQATTMRELALQIVQISGKKIEPKFDMSKPEGDRGRIANCERAREILRWSPAIDLNTGLEKTYRSIETQIWKKG